MKIGKGSEDNGTTVKGSCITVKNREVTQGLGVQGDKIPMDLNR